METEVSIPFTQQPANGSYYEPYTSSPYIYTIHFNIILPSMPWSFKWCPLLWFSYQILYTLSVSLMYTTCTFHLVLLDFITLIISGEKCTLCSFLQPPVTSSLLSKMFPSAPYSRNSSICSLFLVWESKFHAHTNNRCSLTFLDSRRWREYRALNLLYSWFHPEYNSNLLSPSHVTS
jgi:hypothetical protein